MTASPASTKQEALDRMCQLLGTGSMRLLRGSSIPKEIFFIAAREIGIEPVGSMPVLGESIARLADLDWGYDCDSRHTKSKGGSTVTLTGMNRMIEALERVLPEVVAQPDEGAGFGLQYTPARGGIAAPESVVIRDWNALDEATRAHADLQNSLAAFVRDRGLPVVEPRRGLDPAFDVGWRCDQGLVVAEAKTVNDQNRRQQVRLGLGQVLDYRWHLEQSMGQPVLGVLATNEPIRDVEAGFCSAVGIITTSPSSFAASLAPLLAAP